MASPLEQLSKALGIGELPWVIRAYLTLFIFCGILLLYSVMRGTPDTLTADQIKELPASKLFTMAADAEKTILGALIGTLSLAATKEFGSSGHPAVPRTRRTPRTPPQGATPPEDEVAEETT